MLTSVGGGSERVDGDERSLPIATTTRTPELTPETRATRVPRCKRRHGSGNRESAKRLAKRSPTPEPAWFSNPFSSESRKRKEEEKKEKERRKKDDPAYFSKAIRKAELKTKTKSSWYFSSSKKEKAIKELETQISDLKKQQAEAKQADDDKRAEETVKAAKELLESGDFGNSEISKPQKERKPRKIYDEDGYDEEMGQVRVNGCLVLLRVRTGGLYRSKLVIVILRIRIGIVIA